MTTPLSPRTLSALQKIVVICIIWILFLVVQILTVAAYQGIFWLIGQCP